MRSPGLGFDIPTGAVGRQTLWPPHAVDGSGAPSAVPILTIVWSRTAIPCCLCSPITESALERIRRAPARSWFFMLRSIGSPLPVYPTLFLDPVRH